MKRTFRQYRGKKHSELRINEDLQQLIMYLMSILKRIVKHINDSKTIVKYLRRLAKKHSPLEVDLSRFHPEELAAVFCTTIREMLPKKEIVSQYPDLLVYFCHFPSFSVAFCRFQSRSVFYHHFSSFFVTFFPSIFVTFCHFHLPSVLFRYLPSFSNPSCPFPSLLVTFGHVQSRSVTLRHFKSLSVNFSHIQ